MADEINVELSITDPRLIAGLEYARDLYNASLPPLTPASTDAEGNAVPEVPAVGLTSEEYILFVAGSAVESYAQQAERAAKLAAAGL